MEAETPFTRAASWLLAFVIALTLNGYPLAGTLAALLGVESTEVTYPYRAISTAFTLAVAGMVLVRGRFTLDPLMLLFLIAYTVRLYYDMTYTSLPDTPRAMALFLTTVLVPFITINICRYYYVDRRTLIAFLVVGAPSVLLLCAFRAANIATWSDESRFGLDALNPVSVGLTGLYTVVAVYFLWLKASTPVRLLILAPLAFASLYIMVIANARGPIAALVLCLLALSVRRGAVLVALGIATVTIAVLFGDAIANLGVFQRFTSTGTDLSSLERFDRMASSFELMIQYPVTGFGYLENRYYSYPHNLLLESGLALGFGGFAIMFYLQLRYGMLIWSGLRGNAQFVALLGIAGLTSAWLSSTLWGSITFWTPLALLVALAAEQKSRQRRSFFRSGPVSHPRAPRRPASPGLTGVRG